MRLGVDLGGTKIEAVALTDDGTEVVRERIATPAGDYRATLDAIVDLVARVEDAAGPASAIGIGTPGAISPSTGLLRNSNSQALNGQPLDVDLAAALGREITISNDANCFALSEAADGAGAGEGVVFGVILGTGVGGGLVVDGRVLTGPNAIAGEWGHNRHQDDDGRPCYCGRTGCNELFLSGPALEREYAPDRSLPAVEIVQRVHSDATASAVVDRYIDRLASALAVVINIVDPDVVVLGGGMSNVDVLYDEVPARWSQWIFSDAVSTPIRKAVHGDSSGVRGAARL